jgi:hypothetical protein
MQKYTLHYYDGYGEPQEITLMAWDYLDAVRDAHLRLADVTYYDVEA